MNAYEYMLMLTNNYVLFALLFYFVLSSLALLHFYRMKNIDKFVYNISGCIVAIAVYPFMFCYLHRNNIAVSLLIGVLILIISLTISTKLKHQNALVNYAIRTFVFLVIWLSVNLLALDINY